MHKDFSIPQQYRRNIGNHTNWQDDKQKDQVFQNRRVDNLSRCAGDVDKRNHAQTLLQLFILFSFIQNTNTNMAIHQINGRATEKSLSYNYSPDLNYQKNIYPLLPLAHEISVKPDNHRLAKRYAERNDARAYAAGSQIIDKPKLFILVKNDFRRDIDDDIYKLALMKSVPQEIAAINRAIKQNHLRDHWAFITEETDQLIEIFDKYIIYKKAINSLLHSLTKKKAHSLLFEKASELYGLAGDSEEIENERLALKVQLYHLDKLVQQKYDIDYRSFSLTPNPKNDDFNKYNYVESELAAQLIENVINNHEDIPKDHTITYGPAYQARKSFIAYALHIAGIHSPEALKKSLTNDIAEFYKQSLNSLETWMKDKDPTLIEEIADHFYFSLFNYYMANPGTHLAIDNDKVKRMGDFTREDKIDALIYHFNSDVEVRFTPKKDINEIILNVAQEILFSSSQIKAGLSPRHKIATGKTRRPVKRKPVPERGEPNSFAYQRHLRHKKGLPQRVRKPNRKDFPDEESYLQEKLKYEQYLKDRVALRSNTDRERRKRTAITTFNNLEKTHPQKISQQSSRGFTLTTSPGDRGDIVVLSAHAWSEKFTNLLKIPKGKEIFFLGPDGKVLLEAPENSDLLPTSYLVAGEKHPQIFSIFTEEGGKVLLSEEGPSENYDQAKNYRLKYYESTPDEEIKLAVLQNRIKSDRPKMDFLTVDELAGEKKLSDVMNLMKKGEMLEGYNKLMFYACREIKKPGVMKPEGLKGAYEIIFVDVPLSEQARQKRSIPDDSQLGRIEFDGYYLYERFEVQKDNITSYLEGIIPYRNPRSPNSTH